MRVITTGPQTPTGEYPILEIWVDLNYNSTIDPGELSQSTPYYAYADTAAWFTAVDDGEWPHGNGTSSDQLNIRVWYANDVRYRHLTVHNVAPVIPHVSPVSFTTEAGNRFATIGVHTWDVGRFDDRTYRLVWADGVISEHSALASNHEWCNGSSVSLRRIVTSGATLLPARLTVVDDDGGEVSREISQLDMIVNNDDDNLNGLVDLTESPMPHSELEGDMRFVTYSSLLTPDIPRDRGVFELVFNPAVVKVWDSKAKENQIYPTNDDYFGVYFSPSELRDFWVEGFGVGSTEFVLRWQAYSQDVPGVGACDHRYLQGNLLTIRVSGIDLDIDSDNNDGFDPPPGTEWEEFLEDNIYGLGKLVMQNYNDPDAAERYTPLRLRVGTGIQFPETMSIRFDYEYTSDAGHIILWTRDKNDPARSPADEINPGRIIALSDLGYNATTGELTTIFISGVAENAAIKQLKGVEDNEKPDKFITATLLTSGLPIISDKVRYLVTQTDSFFFHFQNKEELRNAIASSRVYGGNLPSDAPADSPKWSQEKLSREQLIDLGIDPDATDVLTDLTTVNPVSGLKAAVYRDYVSNKYIVAYAGTEPSEVADLLTDLIVGASGYTTMQFDSAIEIGSELARVSALEGHVFIATGHSLGGGLASATVVAGGSLIEGDTFNAMGLPYLTMVEIGVRHPSTFSPYPWLVDAYWVDYDILTYIQDNIVLNFGFLSYDPAASAFGIRHKMDSSYDNVVDAIDIQLLHMALDNAATLALLGGAVAGNPSTWLSVMLTGLAAWKASPLVLDTYNAMMWCHYRSNYLYGLLVTEGFFGSIEEDLLGYTQSELDEGRAP